eukprot:6189844-Pleurochrysis_carterae.AAC.5
MPGSHAAYLHVFVLAQVHTIDLGRGAERAGPLGCVVSAGNCAPWFDAGVKTALCTHPFGLF